MSSSSNHNPPSMKNQATTISIAEIEMALARLPESGDKAAAGNRHAAVAMVFAGDAKAPDLCVIRRAERAGDPWSGQMAFPGGKSEPQDDSLRHAAERETLEEVGLKLRAGQFVGALPHSPVRSGGDESIASYRLLPDRMGEACPEGLAGTGAIPVRRVDRQYFSGGPPASGSAAGIGPFLDESDPGALVYVLGAGDHTRSPLVIYRHSEAIFRGSRFVSITMPSETVKPNQMAYIAMPFALVADAFAVAVVASVVVVAGLLVVFVAG